MPLQGMTLIPLRDSFLYQHYERFRRAGGDHVIYVVGNDLTDEMGYRLKFEFEDATTAPREEPTA